MSLLSIFSPKSAEKAIDALIKTGDSLVLTKEEKAEFTQKQIELHLEITKTIANESAPTAVSRRIVGLLVLVPFAFLSIGGAIIHGFAPDLGAHWLEVSETFENPSLAVVMFYFGGHIAKGFKK
jgi:hypothetical protein